MAKVTGLGGVFFKVADTAASAAWYKDKLGLAGDWGIMFMNSDQAADGYSLLSPFKATTDYFAPSAQPFMINLRVDDLDALVADLKVKAVEVLGYQDDEFGKFAWIVDPDGIKLELFQQAESASAA